MKTHIQKPICAIKWAKTGNSASILYYITSVHVKITNIMIMVFGIILHYQYYFIADEN